MNLKKLKRLLCIALSAAMVLSTNMTGYAAEFSAPGQDSGWQLDTEIRDASADEAGIARYVSEDGSVLYGAALLEDGAGAGEETQPQTTGPKEAAAPGQEAGELAPENIVAKIGGTPYGSLEAAIAAAGAEDRIELAQNASLSGQHTYQDLNIETNGYLITIEADAEITLQDTSINNKELAQPVSEDTWKDMAKNHGMLNVAKGARLTIKGGSYTTKGVQLLTVNGEAAINSNDGGDAPQFKCTATAGELAQAKSDDGIDRYYYSGATMFSITGLLTMDSGIVNSDIGNPVGNGQPHADADGMYGIYVNDGGKVVLGQPEQDNNAGPQVTSWLAAICMNATMSPASVEVHSGVYKSSVNYTTKWEQFNAVLYLSATSDVVIDGGQFEAVYAGVNQNTHVISAPYSDKSRNITIAGGTFKSGGDVFAGPGAQPDSVDITGGTFSSDISNYLFGESGFEKDSDGNWHVVNVDNTSIATIGSKGYGSLAEALTEATSLAPERATVVLQGNATLSESAKYDLSNVEIQTKGHTIKIAGGTQIEMTGATMVNDVGAQINPDTGKWDSIELNHVMLCALEGSKLTIKGGSFKSEGVQLLAVEGNVTIQGNAKFECTATGTQQNGYYDGAVVLSVSKKDAVLTMLDGEVTTEVGNGTDCGMFGIYVFDDASVILGDEDGGPTVKSPFAAVGMNATKPEASVTINNGQYESSVSCAQGIEKFNAVLYLSARSQVVINGGAFKAAATNNDYAHVISAPYENSPVNLVIKGGTFETNGKDAFYWSTSTPAQNKKVVKGGTFNTNPTDYLADGYTLKTSTSGSYVVDDACDHTTISLVSQTLPSCWEYGELAHYVCGRCGQKFQDKEGTAPAADSELVIDRKNHDGKYVAAKTEGDCKNPPHRAYFYCENCENAYDSITDLKNDVDGSKAYSERHKPEYYVEGPVTHEYEYDWGLTDDDKTAADLNAFRELDKQITEKAQQTTVTLKCKICGATKEITGATVTIEQAADSKIALTNFKCTEGASITYSATVTIQTGGSTQTEGTGSWTIVIQTRDHASEVTITDTQNVLSDYKKGDSQSKLSASLTCSICGDAQAADKVDVDESQIEGKCEDQNYTLPVTVTFGTGENAVEKETTIEVTVKASAHELVRVPYSAASCSKEGTYAHYKCNREGCGALFWDDSKTTDADKLDPSAVTIKKILHNFGLPKFEWADNSFTAAKATFTCIKCYGSVKVDAAVDLEDSYFTDGQQHGCAEKTELSYPVTAEFNKACVHDDAGTTDPIFGTPVFTYGDKVQDKVEAGEDFIYQYEGTVTRQAVMGHRFTVAVNWLDTSEKYNTVESGVTADLTCKECKGTVKITSKGTNSTATPDGTSVTNAKGSITCTLNESYADGYRTPTCTGDGHDIFTVTVKCRTEDGKGELTYTTTNADTNPENLVIGTDTEKKGHDFYVDSLNWKDGDHALEYPDEAGEVHVRIKCRNEGDGYIRDYTGPKEGVTTGTKVEKSALSCTQDLHNVWPVTVKFTDADNEEHTITQFGYEDDETREPLVIEKKVPAPGHKYSEEGEWVWDEYLVPGTGSEVTVNKTGKVYYTFTCSNPSCSGEYDPNDLGDNEETGEAVGGAWQKRFAVDGANVMETPDTENAADCLNGGIMHYQATVAVTGKDGETKEVTSPVMDVTTKPLGHSWEDAAVNWGEWIQKTDAQGNPQTTKITLGGLNYDVPLYTISAELTCGRCNTEKKTVAGELNDTAVAHTDYYILVEPDLQESVSPDCTTSGSVTYKATVCDKDANPVCGTEGQPQTKTDTLESPGHDYDLANAKFIWTDADGNIAVTEHVDEDKANDRYSYTVELQIPCKKDGSAGHTHTKIVNVPVTIALGNPGSDGCKAGITYTASYTDPELGAKSDTHTYTGSHKIRHITGTEGDATCGQVAYADHFHCQYCGQNYNDPAAMTPIEISFEKLEHSYRKLPKYEWLNEDAKTVQATYTCSNCGDGQLVKAEIVGGEGNVLADPRPECRLTKRESGPEGTYYYTVTSTFNGQTVSGSLRSAVPYVDHKIVNGVCEYCENTFAEVTFSSRLGGTVSTSFYMKDGETVTYDDGTQSGAPVTAEKDAAGNITRVTGIQVPSAPTQSGYDFNGWKLSAGGETFHADQIAVEIYRQILANGADPITVIPDYTPVNTKATVNVYRIVNNVLETEPVTSDTDAAVGQPYPLQADAKVGDCVFSHWSSDADGTSVLSENMAYSLYISNAAEKNIYAVYVASKGDLEIKPAITGIYAVESDGGYKVAFASAFTVPSGCTLQDSGFLYGTKQDVFSAMTEEQLEDAFVTGSTNTRVKQQSIGGAASNIINVSLGTTTANLGYTIWARAYVTYSNDATGEMTTVYSNVATGIYNELKAVAN